MLDVISANLESNLMLYLQPNCWIYLHQNEVGPPLLARGSHHAEHMPDILLEDCSCLCVCQHCGLIFPLQIDFMQDDKSVQAAALTHCKLIIAVASSECICLVDI